MAPTTLSSVRRDPIRASDRSPRDLGLRLGALFGPAVFGVTAAGVALPDVAAGLHASPLSVAWVLTVHALALGIGTALSGRVADVWGIRTVLRGAVTLLVAGTAICALAPSLALLIAGRVVLASGSGAAVAAALTLAASVDQAARPRVLAVFGATIAVFAGSATLLGGLLTAGVSWRLVVVLPALSVVAVPFCLELAVPASDRAPRRRGVDAIGAVLLTVATAALLLLIQAHTLGLPVSIAVGLGVVTVVGVTALARRIVLVPDGFVPRRLVTDGLYRGACAAGAGVYGALFATMYVVPQILAGSRGWDVPVVGLALLPGAALGAAVSRTTPRFVARYGAGQPLLAATTVAAAGALVVAGATRGDAVALLIAGALCFAAFAAAQVILTDRVTRHVEPAARGIALGLLNLAFFVGGAIGSAAAGALSDSLGFAGALIPIAALPLAGAIAAGPARPRP